MNQVSYSKKCYVCGYLEKYIMRDTNVNPSITDEDCYRIARDYIKDGDSLEWCENCKLSTRQSVVSFNLPD